MRLVSVGVPVPFLDLLTYQVPDGVSTPPRGARVVVPLGNRVVTGVVVEPDAAGQSVTDLARIRNLIEVLDDEERDLVRSISLQRWHGAPDSGRWMHQTMLTMPTAAKVARIV